MPNHASPLRRRCLELGSSCGDHQPSSSAHRARGSPDPPWPCREPRARRELGKRWDPEPSRMAALVCSLSTVSLCRMQLLQASFVPFRSYAIGCPTLALGYSWGIGPGQSRHFYAKSCFSAKEKTLGVGCQLRRPPAKQQCPWSQRQPRPSLALWGA